MLSAVPGGRATPTSASCAAAADCGILRGVGSPRVRRAPGLTRRQTLLVGLAAFTAAFAPARRGLARTAQRLSTGRAGAYGRLVATLRDAPDGRFSGLRAAAAAREFATWYAQQDAAIRAHVDAVLDALADAQPLGYDLLAQAALPQAGPDVAPLAAAVALAAATCAVPPDEDERPVAPALWTAP
jgi:hypothetical protein